MVLCLFGCVSLLGFLLAWFSWNPQISVSGQLNWNHPARQAWENSTAARQSRSDVYFYIQDTNPENIENVIAMLNRFVESKKRLFQGSFSSNDFSLRDENSLYHIPVGSLDPASASIIKCRRITENHWATLDISNYCQWLTLQLRDNQADKTVHEDIARFAQSLESAFQSGLYSPLWRLSLNDSHAVPADEASFGFFAIQLNDLDHENRKIAFEELNNIRQQAVLASPSTNIALSGIPLEEFQHQMIPLQSLGLALLGIFFALSIYLLAGFGCVRFHVAVFLSLILGLGGYLGLAAVFVGETNPQTLQIGIVFVFLFLTGAIMMIVHLLHNPLEIRSSLQESILRSVEHYLRTAGVGKGITLVALLMVFAIMMYQQTRTLSGIIPESIPTQWLFFAMIAVLTSFVSNLVLLPVTLTFLVRLPVVDSKRENTTDQNPFGRFMLPSWERHILVVVVLVVSGFGMVRLLKQFSDMEPVKNDMAVLPFYASGDLDQDIADWYHVYDADDMIPRDMASKNKLFHALRTLLMHLPDSGPEIPVSSPAALDQAVAGLCDELALNPDTDAIRHSLQETRKKIAPISLDLYYRIVSDFQRSAVGDLCQQLKQVEMSLPSASFSVTVNPEIIKRFQNEEKSLLLIPDFSQKQLTGRFPLLENHVQDVTGYSLLKYYTFRETHRSSLIVIVTLCCVFVFGFLLFNTSFQQSFQNIAVFITAIAFFLGMLGFLKIPISTTTYFVVFTQLVLISVLAPVMKRSTPSQHPGLFAVHFPTILLITGACIVFSGHLLFLESEVLLLTGRMIIIGWVATFLSFYLWFPNDQTETKTIVTNEAVLILETTDKSFPTAAVHVAENPEQGNEPDTSEPVVMESTDEADDIGEVNDADVDVNADVESDREMCNLKSTPRETPSFCKVWSIGRQSAPHNVKSTITDTDGTPVILQMNTVSGSRKTDSKKRVA